MPITRRILLGLLSSSSFFLSAALRRCRRAALGADAPALSFPRAWRFRRPPAGGCHAVDLRPAGGGHCGRGRGRESAAAPATPSRSDDFSQPLLQVPLSTDAASDYTVRAYLDGLEPDTTYYYFLGGRFPRRPLPRWPSARGRLPGEALSQAHSPRGAGSSSRVGQTCTAPAPGQERDVKFRLRQLPELRGRLLRRLGRACSPDDAAAPADERIQFVLHLGDFIYERCWNTRPDGSALSRRVPPFPDGVTTEDNRCAVSLADYRHLYRTYLADPELQAARALALYLHLG